MRHLDERELRRLLTAGLQAQAQENPARTPACPPDGEWLELAAGILPQAERRTHLEHAAKCAHCGPLLKAAIEDLGLELTAEEESKVASLQSATTEWQDKLAKKITGSATPTRLEKNPAPKPGGLFAWPRWVLTTAATILAAVGGWWAWVQFRAPSVDALLAKAYTERRTLEVRIPGARYAPMRVERGSGGSDLDKPPALLQAETLISENLRKSPNDPGWLQAKARADLLDGNYDSAVKSLQRAMEEQPDSPSMLTDLGSAYFLRAEVQNRATDYGNAIESLSKALAKLPDDPVALFNHALSCERMFLYSQAVADWEHYLRVDPSGNWSDDARANLQRVKQKMAEKEKQSAVPLLSPAEFSAAIAANHENAISIVDQHAERYLQTAIQKWLPEAYADRTPSQSKPAEARRALEYLAEILKTLHDDTWLADFLQTKASPLQKHALQSLLASDEALHSGHYALGAELARKSAQEFRRSGNEPGLLRASFARMIAQTFAFKVNDCLNTLATMTGPLSSTRYRWLQIQTLIQQGLCQYATPEVAEPLRNTMRSAELAKFFHYPELQLRATAFAADYRAGTESADRGLQDLNTALATFWRTSATSTRGENLYTALFDLALARNWHHLEALALAEKINDFPISDPVDQAVNWQLLAAAEERAEDYLVAQASLRRAVAQLAAMPQDSGVVLRKAEIQLQVAGIQLHRGDPTDALATLAGLGQQLEAGDSLSRAQYFQFYGEADLALGFETSAQPFLERALPIIETALQQLPLEADRLQWSRMQGQLYRDLLEIKLKSGTPADAFALWEWYKGASLRGARSVDSNPTHSDSYTFAPPELSSNVIPPETILISYVFLKSSTIAFLFRDGTVHSHILQLPADPELGTIRFLNLSADPSANLSSFNAQSRRLYDVLVAPLEPEIQRAAALQFETDGILDRIPFELLQGPDGRFLADRFEITYSPGLAYGSHPTRQMLSASSPALIVVSLDAQEPSLPPLPEAIDEANEVAGYFRDAKTFSVPQATRAELLRHLRIAEIFHFVGHATAIGGHVGLVLGAGDLLDSRDLVKARPRNLRLAVLSACATANGDDGTFADVNSIARTLAAIGVSYTIASRWNVDSVVTRRLMRAFYSNLMSGKSPGNALRAARSAVRSLPEYHHPYYWGSFAVFGG